MVISVSTYTCLLVPKLKWAQFTLKLFLVLTSIFRCNYPEKRTILYAHLFSEQPSFAT